MPLGRGVRRSLGDGAGVEPVRGGPGPGGEGPVAHPVERAGVGGEVFVDGGPVRGGQAGGFADQQGGAPFVELAGFEGGEGVRHLGHEGFGQAQEPAAFGGGFAPGQGDLRADPGTDLIRGDAGVGLGAALEQVQLHGEAGLFGGRGGFLVLQHPDPIDDPGSVCDGADRARRARQASGRVPRLARSCGRTGRVAAEAGVAVSCRNHFGPLIAVHESSVSVTTDGNNGRTVPSANGLKEALLLADDHECGRRGGGGFRGESAHPACRRGPASYV